MKDFILTLFTLPVIALVIACIGYLASAPKNKLKFFSYSLTLFFITSLPITSYVLSIPLKQIPAVFLNDDYSNAKAVVVLTAGVKKNISGSWIPSMETVNRILIAKTISDDYNLPVVISGGKTSNKVKSEALISKEFLSMNNSIIEQNSINTYESALNLEDFCSKKKGPILLISGIYHSLRSYYTFKTNNCQIKLFKYQQKLSYALFVPSLRGFSNFNSLTYEVCALIYYVLTNKIRII